MLNPRIILALLFMLLITGCSSLAQSTAGHSSIQEKQTDTLIPESDVKSQLMEQFAKWRGVPYRFGGASKKGIDCSALIQRVFLQQFDIALPRTTYYQRNLGQAVSRHELKVGDLVLFRIPGPTGRHIGIYLGENEFMHASSSKGVTISSLDNSYWKRHYFTARRILDDENS